MFSLLQKNSFMNDCSNRHHKLMSIEDLVGGQNKYWTSTQRIKFLHKDRYFLIRRKFATPTQIEIKNKFFSKITNHVSIKHATSAPIECTPQTYILPSRDLDCAIFFWQQQLLNPTPSDMYFGFVLKDSPLEIRLSVGQLRENRYDIWKCQQQLCARHLTSDANLESVRET